MKRQHIKLTPLPPNKHRLPNIIKHHLFNDATPSSLGLRQNLEMSLMSLPSAIFKV